MRSGTDRFEPAPDITALTRQDKSALVLTACHRLTILGRDVYGSDAAYAFDFLRRLNEIEHRLVSLALDLLTNQRAVSDGEILDRLNSAFSDVGATPELATLLASLKKRRDRLSPKLT